MYDNEILKKLIEAKSKDGLREDLCYTNIGLAHPVEYYDNNLPSFEELEKIADFFKISIDFLFGRTKKVTRDRVFDSYKYETVYPYNLIERIVGPIEWRVTEDNMRGLEWALSELTETQSQMLLEYYKEGIDFNDISALYGIDKDRVRQIIAKAERRLRHPSRSRAITNGLSSLEKMEALAKKLEEKEQSLIEREKQVSLGELLLSEKIKNFEENKKRYKESKSMTSLKKEDVGFSLNDLSLLKIPVEAANFQPRTYNILKRADLNSLGSIVELIEKDPENFMKIKGLGRKIADEILQKLDEMLSTENNYYYHKIFPI